MFPGKSNGSFFLFRFAGADHRSHARLGHDFDGTEISAEANGGTMKAECEAGKGTVFFITLPAADAKEISI